MRADGIVGSEVIGTGGITTYTVVEQWHTAFCECGWTAEHDSKDRDDAFIELNLHMTETHPREKQ